MNKKDLGLFLFLFIFSSISISVVVIDNNTRNAERFLRGEKAVWFKHHGKTYGCITANRTSCFGATIIEGSNIEAAEWKWLGCHQLYVVCDHQDRYETDHTIQGWVQDIKELR